MSVTSAELKTLRESLGLTAQWLADQAGVQIRTVRYWEAGRSSVPADVSALLERIDRMLDDAVAQAVAQITDSIAKPVAIPEITLVRYRTDDDLWRFRPEMRPIPVTTHAAMLMRLRRALFHVGIQSVIQYMDPEDYLDWLGDRPDSETERSEWAATR
ncbi:MAG: DUF1870 family protein [Magnetococcales bacterium]|nr:DUF1870 family protein [Magnetococcales bacterium]